MPRSRTVAHTTLSSTNARIDKATTPVAVASRRLSAALFVLVGVRLLFHAIALPLFEGPDEPFHLARSVAFADAPFRIALAGDRMTGCVVSAIQAHPCGPDLKRAFGCAPFQRSGAFNALERPAVGVPAPDYPNYEAHQPPLSYLLGGALLAITPVEAPESRLLILRLLSVILVLAAVSVPLKRLASGSEAAAVAGLLLLLLPGAAEALIRVSNDAPLVLWAAIVVERALHRAPPGVVVVLLAIGPLLKLTAFPVVAFVLTLLWLQGRRKTALGGTIASLVVFVVQAARGWRWGGSLELNAPKRVIAEPVGEMAIGLLHSAYTFIKTVFWLGEWSFFRAPLFLVVFWFFLLLVLGVVIVRSERKSPFAVAHLAGAAVAMASCVTFAVLHRRLFGQWSGLGGYYVWGWAPWIFVAARPALARLSTRFLALLAGFVSLANFFWFAEATRLYGS